MFKSPFGAIADGRFVRFRLRLPKDCGVWHVYLLMKRDGEEEIRTEMSFEWHDNDSLYYSCDIKPSVGLYWYRFVYETENNGFVISKGADSLGVLGNGKPWQLSVYGADFKTPDWLRGGVIYQIFPDRFNRSNKPHVGVPEKRFLRSDWGGQPAFTQNGDPCSLGNDYFGGDLNGIIEKLDYLKSLGVTCIYLNPIFFASSNHRYNTVDYEKIDPLLGDEKDFSELCKQAHKRNIRVILDGVFSHTGDDSKYFDRYGEHRNEALGAAQSKKSPYFSWYKFTEWPHKYHCWWGIETLPEVNDDDESFTEYICGENGILRHWLRLGADGWRLDVADELPDIFLDKLRKAVKAEKSDAFILGEVWEDASNKISYGVRRRYFAGEQLDSVMNYPFATAIVDLVKSGNSKSFFETVEALSENYPPQCLSLMMNHIGTHDTARILTVLGFSGTAGDRAWQAHQSLSENELEIALKRLRLAVALQYTLPGVPSIFYGDEAGTEGWADPFCRACFPWENENEKLTAFYKKLGKMRKDCEALKNGRFEPVYCGDGAVAYIRHCQKDTLLVAVNCTHIQQGFKIAAKFQNAEVLFGNAVCEGYLSVEPQDICILHLKELCEMTDDN